MERSENTTGEEDWIRSRESLQNKVEGLIKELKNIQARVPTMDVNQRERYVSLSKRLVALQEKVRAPGK